MPYLLQVRNRQEALPAYKQKSDLYPNGRHKQKGKALCMMDDVFRKAREFVLAKRLLFDSE